MKEFASSAPISEQLCLRLRAAILNGVYTPGSSFPSVRQIACEEAINPNTVQKTLARLEEEGLLITHGTAGRFVTDNEDVIAAAKEAVQTAFLDSMLEQASRLAISPEHIIRYLQTKTQPASDQTEGSDTLG